MRQFDFPSNKKIIYLMKYEKFIGTGVAVITPFNNGSIDEKALETGMGLMAWLALHEMNN